ncbi:MAG: hypothetical protein ACP5VS_18145, partial [Desulfomonilaceae bacterium]
MRLDNFLKLLIIATSELVQTWLSQLGGILIFLGSSIYWTFKPPYRIREIFRQLDFVGAKSLLLIVMTG